MLIVLGGSDGGVANAGEPPDSSTGVTINGTGKTLYTEWFFSAVFCYKINGYLVSRIAKRYNQILDR
jgi:hypothetical protein